MVFLTRDEAASYVDLIETQLLDMIRNDTEINNVECLANLMSIYRNCKDELKKDGGDNNDAV